MTPSIVEALELLAESLRYVEHTPRGLAFGDRALAFMREVNDALANPPIIDCTISGWEQLVIAEAAKGVPFLVRCT